MANPCVPAKNGAKRREPTRSTAAALPSQSVTLTSEGIERRTQTYTLRVAWDMVERADELKHVWMFITKKQVRCVGLLRQRYAGSRPATSLSYSAWASGLRSDRATP